MVIVETSVFTRQVQELLSDEEYNAVLRAHFGIVMVSNHP